MLQYSTRRPQRFVRGLITLIFTCLSLPAFAAGTIAPNQTLVLKAPADGTAPDGTSDDCSTFGGVVPICLTGVNGGRIGANTSAGLLFARATASISSWYDFDVDPGENDFDTVLNAQISGNGTFNGFLALIAGGEVKGTLDVKLYDLGETDAVMPGEAQLVYQQSLSSHRRRRG